VKNYRLQAIVAVVLSALTAALVYKLANRISLALVPMLFCVVLLITRQIGNRESKFISDSPRHRLISAIAVFIMGPLSAAMYVLYFDASHLVAEADEFQLDFNDRTFVANIFRQETPQISAATNDEQPILVYAPVADESLLGVLEERERVVVDSLIGRVLRTSEVDARYNCFGWVFTDGLGWLSSKSVADILEKHNYQTTDCPIPGDVVVYSQQDCITHVGLVRLVTGGQVVVESKWGPYGRFLHLPKDQPFPGEILYYRSARSSHEVRIVSPGTPEVPDFKTED
jgi:hypothetical protein